ncbi:L-ascorbate metabolism protein UlaG, beta-lactamase superfamily [Devosia lucknowensis]|uniref:L-ascorbate metabolism protein UlaG, beta-lactamase superfamily n=1 Tax=Devosia lucknowensis TaxID=1096929 RepID=A0A1Y6GDL7_9HYPH|nr:MBL fold metallo-hydrolase [Devosia lucknowensis]SMQ86169.1 L-ascorbate metabolism protein UlaG, beta-lactamase superfamily [Devosia lucknowensis]
MVTRRNVVAGMAGLPLAGFAASLSTNSIFAQDTPMADTLATSAGDVTIHPVDHASLVLEWDGKAIYVDPVGGSALYENFPAPSAILITHGHGDHFDVPTLEAIAGDAVLVTNQDVFDKLPEALKANATAMANGDEGTVLDLPIRAIAAHNTTQDRMQYHPVGVGNGYVLTLGDDRIYIAGDTEPTEDMLALQDVSVAFLPMNLPYTMTVEQAVEAINTFKPRIVYPYHYGDSDLSPLETEIDENVEIRLRNWYPNGQG